MAPVLSRRRGFLVAVFLGSLASCSMGPEPMASEADRAALVRVERSANVAPFGAPVDEREVSALLGAEATADASDLYLVYLHGTPGDAEGWADFLLDPVAGLPSVAIDRPGFGESDSSSLATLEGQSRALKPFLGPDQRAILIGHSYGGPLALQAALDYSDRVVGVVVLAGSVAPELEKRRWYNYLAKGLSWILPRTIRRANQEVWPLRADLERMAAHLGDIRLPVSIVHGTDDGLVPIGNAEFLQEALTGATSVKVDKLDGAGHMFIWEEAGIERTRAAIEGVVRIAR